MNLLEMSFIGKINIKIYKKITNLFKLDIDKLLINSMP